MANVHFSIFTVILRNLLLCKLSAAFYYLLDSLRFFHASDVVGRKIVVHGGWNETDTLGDIWIFNTDSFTWMQPRTSGEHGTAPTSG